MSLFLNWGVFLLLFVLDSEAKPVASCHSLLQQRSLRTAGDGDLTDDILALFPASFMPEKARQFIREHDLINYITKWMRSQCIWAGFDNTSDLDFWKAHHNPAKPWHLQPSRAGQAILELYEMDRFIKVVNYTRTFADILWPSDSEMLAGGMSFFKGVEYFPGWGEVYVWENTLADLEAGGNSIDVASLTFQPYNSSGFDLQYFPSRVAVTDDPQEAYQNRDSVNFHGPGYSVDFTNIWTNTSGKVEQVFGTVFFELPCTQEEHDARLDGLCRDSESLRNVSALNCSGRLR